MGNRLLQLEGDVRAGLLPHALRGGTGSAGARATALGYGGGRQRRQLLHRLTAAMDAQDSVVDVGAIMGNIGMRNSGWTLGFTRKWNPSIKGIGGTYGSVSLNGPGVAETVAYAAATFDSDKWFEASNFQLSGATLPGLTLGAIYTNAASLSLDGLKAETMLVVTDNPLPPTPGTALLLFYSDAFQRLVDGITAGFRSGWDAGVEALTRPAESIVFLRHSDVGLKPASVLEGRLNPF